MTLKCQEKVPSEVEREAGKSFEAIVRPSSWEVRASIRLKFLQGVTRKIRPFCVCLSFTRIDMLEPSDLVVFEK